MVTQLHHPLATIRLYFYLCWLFILFTSLDAQIGNQQTDYVFEIFKNGALWFVLIWLYRL